MTLVAALSGRNGKILFADTEEVIGGYSTKTIDKLQVVDCDALRVGIAGASTDGTYADMLQAEILNSLRCLPIFDLSMIKESLANTVTGFYGKHIWPRTGDKPRNVLLTCGATADWGQPDNLSHI